jgi:uncharacterized membrane protein
MTTITLINNMKKKQYLKSKVRILIMIIIVQKFNLQKENKYNWIPKIKLSNQFLNSTLNSILKVMIFSMPETLL